MIVRFTPDAQETMRACAALTADHLQKERAQVILLGIFALAFGLAYLIVPSHWAVSGLLAYFTTLVAFGAINFDSRRRASAMLRGNPHFDESHEIELTRERLTSRCSHVTSEYAWSGIERVTESAEFYILSQGPASGLTVPKRALTDRDDQELRAILRAAAPDGGAHLAREGGAAPAVP